MASCCNERSNLEQALCKEKQCAQTRITDLETKLNQLTELIACKVKDATIAREAQVNLNTEIAAYKALLDQQKARY